MAKSVTISLMKFQNDTHRIKREVFIRNYAPANGLLIHIQIIDSNYRNDRMIIER